MALNQGDTVDRVATYLKDGGYTFPVGLMGQQGAGLTDGVASRYGVQGYPTNYVIDATGKIVWRGVGFDESGIREALRKLGVVGR